VPRVSAGKSKQLVEVEESECSRFLGTGSCCDVEAFSVDTAAVKALSDVPQRTQRVSLAEESARVVACTGSWMPPRSSLPCASPSFFWKIAPAAAAARIVLLFLSVQVVTIASSSTPTSTSSPRGLCRGFWKKSFALEATVVAAARNVLVVLSTAALTVGVLVRADSFSGGGLRSRALVVQSPQALPSFSSDESGGFFDDFAHHARGLPDNPPESLRLGGQATLLTSSALRRLLLFCQHEGPADRAPCLSRSSQ